MNSIICWLTTPEYEACIGVVDIYNVTVLEETDFPSPSRISNSSIVNLYSSG